MSIEETSIKEEVVIPATAYDKALSAYAGDIVEMQRIEDLEGVTKEVKDKKMAGQYNSQRNNIRDLKRCAEYASESEEFKAEIDKESSIIGYVEEAVKE